MNKFWWTFLNSHLFLGTLTLLFGGLVASFLSARWQRLNHRHQVGIKALRSLCSYYVAWLTALTASGGQVSTALGRALQALMAIVIFAQNLFPTDEMIKKAQAFLNSAQDCTFSKDESKQMELLELTKDAFREFAISLRAQIGLAPGRKG